jgi:site-specific DNA-methyltransferase (adenine-specific)
MKSVTSDSYQIFCCDCISGAQSHLAENSIDLIITDPPYGIGGDLVHRHYKRREEYVIDGYVEIMQADYAGFSLSWIKQAERILRPGGSIYIVSGYSNLIHILNALEETSLVEMNHIIWKYNFGVYTRNKYVSSHYHVLFWTKPGGKRIFNTYARFDADSKIDGRSLNYADREDVWIINRDYKPGEVKNKNELPLALLQKIIEYSSQPGDYIADLFMGGFSTAVATIGLNRQFVGFEINTVAFRHGIKKIQSIQRGFLIQDKQSTREEYPRNQGKRWTEQELTLLYTRYSELLPQFKTKRKIIEQLQQEFQRGYFSILNRLELHLREKSVSNNP